MGAAIQFISRTMSPGATPTESPRLPPLTRISSKAMAESSSTVGSSFFWARGLMPPTL